MNAPESYARIAYRSIRKDDRHVEISLVAGYLDGDRKFYEIATWVNGRCIPEQLERFDVGKLHVAFTEFDARVYAHEEKVLVVDRAYNATVWEYRDDEAYGCFVAYAMNLGGELKMLAGNGAQCTGYEYKASDSVALYDTYLRMTAPPKTRYEIVLDGCQGYKDRINGLMLPPTYKG